MKTLLILTLLSAIVPFALAQQKSKVYNLLIGTYTQLGKSDGIYVYRFNPRTVEFAPKSEIKGIKNPSYLTSSKDGKFVYSVNETNDGTISAFSFNSNTGKLALLNTAPSGGSSPCYISVDEKRKFAFVGNYGGGSLSAVSINADGSFGTDVQTIQHSGKGIKSNQDKPHVHATVLSPDNRFLLVPDLGTDKVNVYKVTYSKSTPLSAAVPDAVQAEPGNGPRHITFDPSGKSAYLIQEMTGVITAYTYSDGKLSSKQSVALTVPGFTGKVDAADIHTSPDGKFLYGSLRGDINEIVIYAIDRTGIMTYVGRQTTGGKTPRNFAIDPSGNYLLVGNQNSDEIIIFRRDQKTGLLTDTGKKIAIGAPVCLQFIEE